LWRPDGNQDRREARWHGERLKVHASRIKSGPQPKPVAGLVKTGTLLRGMICGGDMETISKFDFIVICTLCTLTGVMFGYLMSQ
jgi:hypothetical protein